MSNFPDKVNYWREREFKVEEKRGWVRKIRSEAKRKLNKHVYEEYVGQVGWESIM